MNTNWTLIFNDDLDLDASMDGLCTDGAWELLIETVHQHRARVGLEVTESDGRILGTSGKPCVIATHHTNFKCSEPYTIVSTNTGVHGKTYFWHTVILRTETWLERGAPYCPSS